MSVFVGATSYSPSEQHLAVRRRRRTARYGKWQSGLRDVDLYLVQEMVEASVASRSGIHILCTQKMWCTLLVSVQ